MLKRHDPSVTRRRLIRFLATTAAGSMHGWPNVVRRSRDVALSVKQTWVSLQPRSMFFSENSPTVQIRCLFGTVPLDGKIKALRVNDEVIPCLSQPATAGSYWQCDATGVIVYVEERVVQFDLSRFPSVQARLG